MGPKAPQLHLTAMSKHQERVQAQYRIYMERQNETLRLYSYVDTDFLCLNIAPYMKLSNSNQVLTCLRRVVHNWSLK